VDYYGPNLTFTGGNFMVDGWGKGFCSELVFDENGTTVDEISELDSVLGSFMDLDTVYTFPRFFGIDHIDMSMKLLNDHTLILNEYPAGNQYNDEMDSCETIIEQITNPWGQPVDVHRITTASWNGGTPYTYTNAIFVNNKVLLPIYGGTHATRDAQATALWESLLPGYSIHGFNCTSIIPLQGAIHCVVKEIIHRHLIRIEYPPLPEELAGIEDGEITARIVSLGTLDPDSIELYWATDEAGPWFAETFASLGNDSFHVNIPPQPADDIVYYYVRAKNTEGNWTTMPRYGPEAHYQTSFPVTTPAAPESLTVWTDGDDVILQWTPVTQDILGNPVSNVSYLVHGSPNPDSVMFPENEIGVTTETTFIVNDFFTDMNLKMYFRVVAFIP
jgi:hypothetical protein